MKKTAILTISGLISGAAGIFLGYLFLKSLNSGTNFVFLIFTLILIAVSTFCLFKATNPKVSDSIPDIDQTLEKTATFVANNNSTLVKWQETNEQRDKLKMLKIATKAQEESEKEM